MNSTKLLVDWQQRFSPRHMDLATLTAVFPYVLDTEGMLPDEGRLARAILDAVRSQPGVRHFEVAFEEYLSKGELEAAQRLIDLLQEADLAVGQQIVHMREEWENRRLELQTEYRLNKSRWQEQEPQLSALNLLDRYNQRQTDVYREEAERLYQRHRLGPASACLHQVLEIFEPLLEEARAQVIERLEALRSLITSGGCPSPAAGEHYVRLVGEYLHHNDIRLAREYLEKAILASNGKVEPENREAALEPYIDPGEVPNIDLKVIVEWLSGRSPKVVDSAWETFRREWAMPQLCEAAAGPGAELDEQTAGNLAAVAEAIRMLLNLRDSKVVSTQTRVKSTWRLFFRNFFASLGVPANFVGDTVQPLKGANEELFGWTEVRRISCVGSFLDTDFLRQPLLLLAARDPMNPQHQFLSLVSHLKVNQMLDRVGVVITPHRLTQQRIKSFIAQAPRVAVLDEAAILKILLAPTPEIRMSRFVAQVAGQLGPEVINPFRSQGPVHETMFFGRQRQLDELLSPAGPAILYGGRRLGKSSILQELARRFEAAPERVAVYLPVTNAGTGAGTVQAMLRTLWEQIYQKLKEKAGILVQAQPLSRAIGITSADFRARVTKVLEDNKRLQILILLDEADALVEALTFPDRFSGVSAREEAAAGGELKDLVQKYQGRLQIILAGFQHIFRAAMHPRSPFFNFRGKNPLPIGVLDEGDAYHLVTRSLSLLGLQFQGRAPVDLVLLYTGRHPSLMQAFCEQILYRVRRANRRVVESADVDAVFHDRDFRRQMFEVIHMNVEDDSRNSRERRLMRMVLYTWLHSEGSVTDLGQRQVVYPHEIYDRLTGLLGSDATKQVLRLAEVDDYLHDLYVLGVVQRTTDNGYVLVNPHLPALLRQFRDTDLRDEIERIWLQLQEPIQSRQRARVSRTKDPGGWTLTPISEVDEERIDEAVKRRMVCIIGSNRMGKSLALDWLQRRMPSTEPGPIKVHWDGSDATKGMKKLAKSLGTAAERASIAKRLVQLAEQARPEQPLWLIFEDVDDAASGEAWRLWEEDGVLAPLTDALRELEQRDMAGRMWVLATGGVELARAWQRWPEYMEASATPVFLRRFTLEDRAERHAWMEANLEDRGLTEQARDQLWKGTLADPRLLEGFVTWAKSFHEGTMLTEAHIREYLNLLNPDTPKAWPEPVRSAVADVPMRVRALVALATAWATHFGQDGSLGIQRSMLELVRGDGSEWTQLLERVPEPLRAELRNLPFDQIVRDLLVLVDLDELARPMVRPRAEDPDALLACSRPGDIWSALITRAPQTRK